VILARLGGYITAVNAGSRLSALSRILRQSRVVAYCSNLGVRWGAVTDGRYFKLYHAPMLGVSPEERLVLSVDLADYKLLTRVVGVSGGQHGVRFVPAASGAGVR
jgi:predicted type IV restriction endonuclease